MLCPKCNCELEIDGCYDIWIDDEFYTEKVVGGCPNCGKVFQWEINYKFFNESDLMECN